MGKQKHREILPEDPSEHPAERAAADREALRESMTPVEAEMDARTEVIAETDDALLTLAQEMEEDAAAKGTTMQRYETLLSA